MSLMLRTSAILLALVLAAALPAPLLGQEALQEDLAGAIQEDLQRLTAELSDPSAQQYRRDESARRLLARNTPESRRVLAEALMDVGNRGGQLAVARALAADPQADPRFIVPLFALLGPDRALSDAAAQALANYKSSPEVLTRLGGFALGTQRETVRTAAIRAIGAIPERRAAEILITLLGRDDEPAVVRAAAADALVEMTGRADIDRDVRGWRQWWAENRGKSDAQFKADLLLSRSARHDRLRVRHERLAEELETILTEHYQSASEEQRPAMLLRYLRSGEPEVRIVGTRMIYDDVIRAQAVPSATREQLRHMIGDSSIQVRLEVARTLRVINDAAALEPLLVQLAQEPEPAVRAAIASALAPIRDLRAVPQLVGLLQDESSRVAEAAAQALGELGPLVREQDPQLARQTARALQEMLDNRTTAGGAGALRAAGVEAMIPLRDQALLQTFLRLLRPEEPVRVRQAALRALGELGEARAADTITIALEDPEPAVRLEAVNALGNTANFEHAEALYRRLNPAVEPDENIRSRAWNVLESLFPGAPEEQLVNWADRFHAQPQRRLIVLQALTDRLLSDRREEPLAIQRQNIGETLMRLNRPADAAVYFRLALDYWNARNIGMRTEPLIRQLMEALLLSRQYARAVEFASQAITADPSQQQTMGSMIRSEAERLRDANDFQNALALIDETKRMTPELGGQYASALEIIEQEIREELMKHNDGQDGTAGHRSVYRNGARIRSTSAATPSSNWMAIAERSAVSRG